MRRRQAEESEKLRRVERGALDITWSGIDSGMESIEKGWKPYMYAPRDKREEKERRRSMHAGWHVSPSSLSASNSGRESYLDLLGHTQRQYHNYHGTGANPRTGGRVDVEFTNSESSTTPKGLNMESGRFGGIGYGGARSREADSDIGSSACSGDGIGMGTSFNPLSESNLEKKPSKPSLRIYIPGSAESHSSSSLNLSKDKDNSALNSKPSHHLPVLNITSHGPSRSQLDLPSTIPTPQSFLPLGNSPGGGNSNSLGIGASARRVSATIVRLSSLGFSGSGTGYGAHGLLSAGASSAFTMSTATTTNSGTANGGIGVRAVPPGLGIQSFTSTSNTNFTSSTHGVTKPTPALIQKSSKPKSSWKPFHIHLPKSKSRNLHDHSQISLPVRDKPSHPFLHEDPSATTGTCQTVKNPGAVADAAVVTTVANANAETENDVTSPGFVPPSAYPSSILDIRKRPVSGATMTTRVTVGTIGTLGTVGTRASAYSGFGGYTGFGYYGGEEADGGLFTPPPVPPVPALPSTPLPAPVKQIREDNSVPSSKSNQPKQSQSQSNSEVRVSRRPSSRPLPQPEPQSPTNTLTHSRTLSPTQTRRLTGPRRLPSVKARAQQGPQEQVEEAFKGKGKKAITRDEEICIQRQSFTPFSIPSLSDDPPPYRQF